MAKEKKDIVTIIPDNTIIRKIYVFRGQKVMLDRDLAELYGVETRALNQAVKRNRTRFPADFMFQLNENELKDWTSQIVITNAEKMGIRRRPFVFTEQGVAMLSGVISSVKAIEMNIAIMRAFVEIRNFGAGNKKMTEQIKMLFERIGEHDVQLSAIYEAMESLMEEKQEEKIKKITWEERERIGFKK